MNHSLKHKLFSTTECLSEQTLFDYIDKKLTAKEEHIVEKHLLECDFCSDALEGLQLLKNRTVISSINKKVNAKTIKKTEGKVISFNPRIILSIAATLLLVMGSIFFFNYFLTSEKVMNLAIKQEKKSLSTPSEEISMDDKTGKKKLGNYYLKDVAENKEDSLNADLFSYHPKPEIIGNNEEAEKQKGEKEINTFLNKTDQANFTDSLQDFAIDESSTVEYYKNSINQGRRNDRIETTSPSTTLKFQDKGKDLDGIENAKFEQTPNIDISKAGEIETKEIFSEKPNIKEGGKNINTNSTTISIKEENRVSGRKKQKELAVLDKEETTLLSTNKLDKNNSDATVKISLEESKPNSFSRDSIYLTVDEKPQYPGGDAQLIYYFQQNGFLTEPNKINTFSSLATDIYVHFIINKEGKAIQAKIVKSPDKETEKNLIDLINKMPLWKPGKLKGQTVAVEYTLPLKILAK